MAQEEYCHRKKVEGAALEVVVVAAERTVPAFQHARQKDQKPQL